MVLAFVVIDSLAQTVYAATLMQQFHPKIWLTTIFGPLIGLAGFGRTIFSALGSKTDGKRFSIPVKLITAAAAFLIVALTLIAVDFIAHAIAWKWDMPLGKPPNWTTTQRLNEAKQL